MRPHVESLQGNVLYIGVVGSLTKACNLPYEVFWFVAGIESTVDS